MNTMISAASLATATTVAMPPITPGGPAADGVSFPDLAARFLALRERWKSATVSDDEWEEIGGRLTPVVTAIVNQPPKSLCDLGWQTEAFLTWADDFEVIEEHDDTADRMLKTFLANIRLLAGPLPTLPVIVPAAERIDPIFAAITAHRSAFEKFAKAVKAADVQPSRRTMKQSARIAVGLKDGTESSWTQTDGGGFTLVVTPTGRKETVYASSLAEIRQNVPKELKGDARQAWIADRDAELEAAERRIANRWARTKIGKLESTVNETNNVERERMWDLIWTTPRTTDGLAALLSYCRESGSINEMVGRDEWADVLEWNIESAVCAIAGLPAPPMTKIVASLRKESSEEEVADA